GAISDRNFGQSNPNATRYDPDILRGWGVRDYLWEVSTEIQRQLGDGISVRAGYYHNWAGNFFVTNNQAVTPADYSPFCVTAPSDARLPGGGGYSVCGLADIAPARFGVIQNLVTSADQFGK